MILAAWHAAGGRPRDRVGPIADAFAEAARLRALAAAPPPAAPAALAELEARALALAAERDETPARALARWDDEHADELQQIGSALRAIDAKLAAVSPATFAAEAEAAARALVADVCALADVASRLWPYEPAAADAAVLEALSRSGDARARLLGAAPAVPAYTAAARAALERCR